MNPEINNTSNSKFSIVLLLVFIIAIVIVIFFQIRKVDNGKDIVDDKVDKDFKQLSYENASLIISDIQEELKKNPPLTDKQINEILKTIK